MMLLCRRYAKPGAPNDGACFRSSVVGRARSAYALAARTPAASLAPSRLIRTSSPGGRTLHSRASEVGSNSPLTPHFWHRGNGTSSRRASVGGTPGPNITKPPLPRKFPTSPPLGPRQKAPHCPKDDARCSPLPGVRPARREAYCNVNGSGNFRVRLADSDKRKKTGGGTA